MSDIGASPLSAIAPVIAATSARALASFEAGVAGLPDRLVALERTIQIAGTVSAVTKQGTTVETPVGPVVLTGALPVRAGQSVTITLPPSPNGAPASAQLQPGPQRGDATPAPPPAPTAPPAPSAPSAAATPPVAAQAASTPAQAKAADTVFEAVILPGENADAEAGTTVPLRLLSATPAPPTSIATAPGATVAGAPAPQALAAAPANPTAAPSPTTPTPLAAPPSSAQPTAATAPSLGQTAAAVQAQIVAVTPDGRAIAVTSAGEALALPAALKLGEGTTVALQQAAPQTRAPTPFDPVASRGWPALEQALATPGPGAAALKASLPQAGPGLAPALTLFVAGLTRRTSPSSSSAAEPWPGNARLSALRAQNPELAARLGEDTARLQSRGAGALDHARTDAPRRDEGWRTLPLPILDGGRLDVAALKVRDEDAETATGTSVQGTRFVVDAAPSRVGPVQLDGIVRQVGSPVGTRSRVDLILRTREALPASARQEIGQAYTDALTAIGAEGRIAFRTEPARPAGPAPDLAVSV